jgi:hypothetical protein
MTLKGKRNETVELDASPIQPHAEDASANYPPSQEEIRRRAYEIYLERGGLPGSELDDWHRAERELQKVALFTQGWNRLQRRRSPGEEPSRSTSNGAASTDSTSMPGSMRRKS